jgi:hypothetical protein
MNGQDVSMTATWAPCRRHLLDLAFAVPVPLRERAHWRCSFSVFQAIEKDPDLKSNWQDRGPHVNAHERFRLFDMPVHVNGRGDTMELIIPADCRPGGG